MHLPSSILDGVALSAVVLTAVLSLVSSLCLNSGLSQSNLVGAAAFPLRALGLVIVVSTCVHCCMRQCNLVGNAEFVLRDSYHVVC